MKGSEYKGQRFYQAKFCIFISYSISSEIYNLFFFFNLANLLSRKHFKFFCPKHVCSAFFFQVLSAACIFIDIKINYFMKIMRLQTSNQEHPISGQAVIRSNWQTGGAWFKSRSRLSNQPFRVFRGFLRNSRKYGLGSLRKIPTEDNPPIVGPGSTSKKLPLQPTTNQPTN